MKVYKGRQKLNFEQAGQYYSHAYKIGVEHGKFTERERIADLLQNELGAGVDIENTEIRDAVIKQLIELIKGEQK